MLLYMNAVLSIRQFTVKDLVIVNRQNGFALATKAND